VKRLLVILIAAAMLMTMSLAIPTQASNFTDMFQMENWSTSGISEGTTEIIPSSGSTDEAQFKYNVDLRDPSGHGPGVPYRTVTFSTASPMTADITFDWNYWFWHAWAGVQGDLWVFASGPSGDTTFHLVDHPCGGPVTETGTCTIHVNEGYTFGFTMGGRNSDWASYLFGTLTISEVTISGQIDIKPGSDPNSINLGSNGVLPVAVITTPSFDAGTIDPETVKLEGVAPAKWALADVDADGDADLILHFDTPQLAGVLSVGDTEATLTAETTGGTGFQASDSVRILK
jgi:hypothetical protein